MDVPATRAVGQPALRAVSPIAVTDRHASSLLNERVASLVGRTGLEPVTPCASCKCATNCANGPGGGRGYRGTFCGRLPTSEEQERPEKRTLRARYHWLVVPAGPLHGDSPRAASRPYGELGGAGRSGCTS